MPPSARQRRNVMETECPRCWKVESECQCSPHELMMTAWNERDAAKFLREIIARRDARIAELEAALAAAIGACDAEHPEIAQQRARITELEAALREIAKGAGAYSRDPLTHAHNCIEDMKGIATKALGEGK